MSLQLIVTKVSKEQEMVNTGDFNNGRTSGSVRMQVDVVALCDSYEQYAEWEKVLGKTLTVTER